MSIPPCVTWSEKSAGLFVPPPFELSTTFLTISVAFLTFTNVQWTLSPASTLIVAALPSTVPPVPQLALPRCQPTSTEMSSVTWYVPGTTVNDFEPAFPSVAIENPSSPPRPVKWNVPSPPIVFLTIVIVGFRELWNVQVTESPYLSELRSRLVSPVLLSSFEQLIAVV